MGYIAIEIWGIFLLTVGHSGAFHTDLSKAFNYTDHEFLIAKLNAYGFDNDAVKSICSHFKTRKKIRTVSFAEILLGVRHESILGLLLFNAYISDCFQDIYDPDFSCFADDNTPYSCLSDTISVLGQHKGRIDSIFDWFTKKIVKGKAEQYHLITSSKTVVEIELSNITVISEEQFKPLEILHG